MIPAANGFLLQDFTVEEQTSDTYRMDIKGLSVRGNTGGLEAVKQYIYKILNTERYRYPIYSKNFGVELADLFGEPVSYVLPEIKRRIEDALSCDSRIESVGDFVFNVTRGKVYTTFTVSTIFGNTTIEKAVEI